MRVALRLTTGQRLLWIWSPAQALTIVLRHSQPETPVDVVARAGPARAPGSRHARSPHTIVWEFRDPQPTAKTHKTKVTRLVHPNPCSNIGTLRPTSRAQRAGEPALPTQPDSRAARS